MKTPCTSDHTCRNCTVDARCDDCARNKFWCDDYQAWIASDHDATAYGAISGDDISVAEFAELFGWLTVTA